MFDDPRLNIGYLKNESLTVGELRDIFKEIPEQKRGTEEFGYCPTITSGSEHDLVDKVFVSMTGGTNPDSDLLAKMLEKQGVSTVVLMHCGNDFLKNAQESTFNVINTVHMPSDSIGMNQMFDNVLRYHSADIEIQEMSGFHRVPADASRESLENILKKHRM